MNTTKTKKICKFFVKGKCTQENCPFEHKENVCKKYFFEGKCKHGTKCKFLHVQTLKKRPKNTENFHPDHKKADMCVKFGNSSIDTLGQDVYVNDVILVNNFIKQNDPKEMFGLLMNEIEVCTQENEELWKLWHGDTHLIADDNVSWKEKVPSFQKVIDEIEIQIQFVCF